MLSPQSPRGEGTPHLRLNSGTHEVTTDDNSAPQVRPGTARTTSARSLTQSTRPGTAGSGLRGVPSVYTNGGVAESAEMLLPPRKMRPRMYKDESESPSAMSSRRTSWSSDMSRGPFASPFDDSRAPSRAGSDDDLNTQTVSEKFNILPSSGLLLYPEDVEKDDYLHNPDPNDKEQPGCDMWNKRGLANVGGLAFLGLGIIMLFIGYPVLTFVDKLTTPEVGPCTNNPLCISGKESEPLLKNLRSGLIDPDTPESAMSRISYDGTKQVLVFSDEFNTDGRTFYDGDDPYFEAVDIWYGATQDLEWYDPDAAYTQDGTLNLKFDNYQNHGLQYRSGMIQSWNKLCYKGGHLEASISLPGKGNVSGFWPGFWTMGNLARPGYLASTDGLWPYSYHDECDVGITPNQSSYDGLSFLPGMKLPSCTCKGEDHPNSGKSRSAPEIDALEGSVQYLGPGETNAVGVVSQSFQAAPFDVWYMPDYDYTEVYDNQITMLNSYKGGPYQQANSALTTLNNDWYDGNQYQLYAFEYKTGSEGFITWYVGEEKTWTMKAESTRANGNIGTRVIPEEPLSIIANFGMSNSFAAIDHDTIDNTLLPATMRIDYIRIYQPEDNQIMTCDPENYPTTEYIKKHPEAYSNPNLTDWASTGYDWPQNSFMNDCKE
ncbi:glycoside hydrolase family 16 protein [Dothidotthia symphoricarpi CBS 119687]|uniref:Glycoside hydrolase family 16 protein n=1 Tax=Dothidotthia symphoricarpi CBS 119687 TaxID=1392245 RepID=A0A6A6AGQ9_9PLEO|nr:glycoside hydrolase family 16 protein [Dothidotthia symphoricarpi CBS 119687]KAF2131119.1 glycoside hydrolase family 16 protein [Dothidotthia symphoricarpi CBS 119687]